MIDVRLKGEGNPWHALSPGDSFKITVAGIEFTATYEMLADPGWLTEDRGQFLEVRRIT